MRGERREQFSPVAEAAEKMHAMVEEQGGKIERQEGKMHVRLGEVEAEVTVDMNGRYSADLTKEGKTLVSLKSTDLETIRTNLIGYGKVKEVSGEAGLPESSARHGIDYDEQQERNVEEARTVIPDEPSGPEGSRTVVDNPDVPEAAPTQVDEEEEGRFTQEQLDALKPQRAMQGFEDESQQSPSSKDEGGQDRQEAA